MSPKPPGPWFLYLPNRCIHTNLRELQELLNENTDALWHGGVTPSIVVCGTNMAPDINKTHAYSWFHHLYTLESGKGNLEKPKRVDRMDGSRHGHLPSHLLLTAIS